MDEKDILQEPSKIDLLPTSAPELKPPEVNPIDDLNTGKGPTSARFQGDANRDSAIVGYNTGIGKSKYDKNIHTSVLSDLVSLDEILQRNRASQQTGWSQFGNAALRLTNIIPEAIGTVASALDIEDYFNSDDEVGNWLTNAMEEWKQATNEALPIYRESPGKPLDIGDSAWWFENGSSLVQSIGGFAIGGGVITKGLVGLSKLAKAKKLASMIKMGQNTQEIVGGATQSIVTASALNQAEAILEAKDVYEVTFNAEMAKEDADEGKARQKAADAASVTINTNRLNILLNLSSASMFLKTPKLTRNILKKQTTKRNLGIGTIEGFQESAEEVINFVSSQKGKAFGRDEVYSYKEIMKDIASPEALEAGILGFMGGLGQTAVTKDLVNRISKTTDPETGDRISIRDYNNKAYNTQQAILQEYKQYEEAADVKSFTTIFNTVMENVEMFRSIRKALDEGNDAEVNNLINLTIDNQAFNAFENGTTEQFIAFYEDLAKGEQKEGMPDNYKERVAEALSKIKKLEKVYNSSFQFNNGKEVYLNRARKVTLDTDYNKVQSVISQRYGEVMDEVDKVNKLKTYSLPKKNKIGDTFSFDLDTMEDGTIFFDPETERGATTRYKKFVERIKKTPEYAAYQSAKNQEEAILNELEELNTKYNEITTPKYQAEYKKKQIAAIEKMQEKLKKESTKAEEENDNEEAKKAAEEDRKETEAAERRAEAEARANKNKLESNLNWIKDNINEGEEIILPDGVENYAGQEAKLLKITDTKKGFQLVFQVGEEVIKVESGKAPSVPYDNQVNDSEGGDDTLDATDLEVSTDIIRKNPGEAGRPHARLLSTTDDGTPLPGIPQAFLDWEKEPINKLGTEVTFEIETELPADKNLVNWEKAIKLSKQANLTDQERDFVISFLPIKVKVSDEIYTYITTFPATKDKDAMEAWLNTEKPLRTEVVNHLLSTGNLDGINSTIAFQYGGKLQVTPTVKENSLLDINQIDTLADLSFYMANENGRLVDSNGEASDRKIDPKWKGTIFIMVKKANGESFPLKLNVKKFSEKPKVELVFDIYSEVLSNNLTLESQLTTLSKEKQDAIKETLAEELSLFKPKGFNDLTIKELVDVLIWQDSKHSDTKVTIEREALYYGGVVVQASGINNEVRAEFVEWVMNNKRRHIKFKPKKGETDNDLNLTNPKYVKYLVDNKILNTNVDVSGPIFGGFSYIYIEPQISKPIVHIGYNKSIESMRVDEVFGGWFAKKYDDKGKEIVNDDFYDEYNKEGLLKRINSYYGAIKVDAQNNQFTPKDEKVGTPEAKVEKEVKEKIRIKDPLVDKKVSDNANSQTARDKRRAARAAANKKNKPETDC